MKVAQFIFGGMLGVFLTSPCLFGAAPTPAPADPNDASAKRFRFGEGTAQALQLANDDITRYNRRYTFDPSALEMRGPLVIYSDGGELANGRSLASARLTGYYYLAEVSGQFFVAVTESKFYAAFVDFGVSSPPAPGPLRVEDRDRSPNGIGAHMSGILQNLAANDRVRAGSFEVRLLEIQSLGELPSVGQNQSPSAKTGTLNFLNQQTQDPPSQTFQVLWLKSDPGGADLIFPVGAMPNKALQTGKLYELKDFQDALQSFARPVPLTKEMLGATELKQPKAAARAALALIQALRSDADYASPAAHPALLSDLNVLEALAQAIVTDEGPNAATGQKLLDEFNLALAQAVSRTSVLAQRSDEAPARRDKSLAFEAKFREIQNQ